jgi:hypothetical protein
MLIGKAMRFPRVFDWELVVSGTSDLVDTKLWSLMNEEITDKIIEAVHSLRITINVKTWK